MSTKIDRPNFNVYSGYAYGVILGNRCPELLDDIFTHGENLTVEGIVNEISRGVGEAVERIVELYSWQAEEFAERVREFVEDEIDDYLEQPEECEYRYTEDTENGQVYYRLGWLGGAPHIWVLKSPYLAWCRPCSPCVPGAGDLGTLTDREGGMLAHSVPPDCFPEEVQAKLKQEREDDYIVLWVEP